MMLADVLTKLEDLGYLVRRTNPGVIDSDGKYEVTLLLPHTSVHIVISVLDILFNENIIDDVVRKINNKLRGEIR